MVDGQFGPHIDDAMNELGSRAMADTAWGTSRLQSRQSKLSPARALLFLLHSCVMMAGAVVTNCFHNQRQMFNYVKADW